MSAVACVALTACNVSTSTNDTTAVTNRTTAVTTVKPWAQFRDGFIDGVFKLDPAFAVYQGKHEYDGGIPDWSPAGLRAQADFFRKAIADARAYDKTKMSKQDAFERDYLIQVSRGKLFWLEDADQPHRNPAYYVGGGLDPNVYIARNYADAKTRMQAIIKFLRQVPSAAANIRTNLKTPMPASFVKYGVAGFKGFADYYTGDARKAFAGVKDKQLQKDFADASTAASKAMSDLAAWLGAQQDSATQDF
ncbi:MAG: DUF885 family protein, partial [Proteobacteria bacterium]|nr:DUF885 family protein [Pseudomonadota bacterium]